MGARAAQLALQQLQLWCSADAVQDGIHGVLPLYHGTRDALRTIVREEGWQALYAGLSPALLGAGARASASTSIALLTQVAARTCRAP